MCELVSILIPAYNAEKWIVETIRSALDQTWPNKEIIIVNDGSSDNTLAIAKEFESKSVRVISQENKGASAARNTALHYAQGDYIQYLDADDLLAPNKIAEQLKVADSGRTNRILYSSPFGVFYWRVEKVKFNPTSLWQDLTPLEWFINHFSDNLWMSLAAYLVSRRLTEGGGPWDERLSLNDDGEYFCRVVAASESIKFVREAKCYHRTSGFNQLSLSTSESACISMLLSLKLSIRHLRSLEESERTRRASLSLLQMSLPFFYIQKTELLKEINTLALELGGELMVPRFSWKFNLVRRLFGWKIADKAMTTLRKLRLARAVKWDEMLYRITKSSNNIPNVNVNE
jgi:glycosyltransferase involved in cell wall biosynthesis